MFEIRSYIIIYDSDIAEVATTETSETTENVVEDLDDEFSLMKSILRKKNKIQRFSK